MHLFKFWFWLIVASFGAYLVFFNQEPVHINLKGISEFKMMTGIALLASFLLGAFITSIYFVVEHMKNSFTIKNLKKKIVHLEGKPSRLKEITTTSRLSNHDSSKA